MFGLDTKAVDILTSREGIRSQLVEYAKSYLELENVDLYKTSFVSYIINTLSILAANQLYYTSSIYREFFLTEAQMAESIYNLARWIGYNPEEASPASANIMLTIPLTFKDNDVSFVIPSDYIVKAGDIPYTISNSVVVNADMPNIRSEVELMRSQGTAVQVLENKSVTARSPSGYQYPVVIDSSNNTASFLVPFKQYETVEFNFQVPSDLEFYQFWSFKIEYDGMPWQVEVYEEVSGRQPGSGDDVTYEKLDQAENNTLYTMTETEKKYVYITSVNSMEIFFGNGVIGKQPTAGHKIKVILYLTKGEDGRVISSTLTDPDRLYYKYIDSGTGTQKTLPIKITTTNPAPAEGGTNIPSTSTIKSRAIANLRSKKRFVSEDDYNDIEEIVPNTPLSDSKPILKRSDIKVNEIMMFTKLKFQDEICPTRNVVLTADSTSIINSYIPSGTVTAINNEQYETMFDMRIDNLTQVAEYEYTVNEIDVTPSLESSSDYARYCYIVIPSITVTNPTGRNIDITCNVSNVQDEVYDFECSMKTGWDSKTYAMATEYDTESPPNIVSFYYRYSDYLDISPGSQRFTFYITGMVPKERIAGATQDERKTIATYQANCLIRKDLSDYMMSIITDMTSIHNVPVIKSSYLEEVDRPLFELVTIQSLINNINMNSKRMLTDFINVKFCNTTGIIDNMQYNSTTIDDVISKSLIDVPDDPEEGDRYIVNGTESLEWANHKNKIAQYRSTGSWTFTSPSTGNFVYIVDEGLKYYWIGYEWFLPRFNIPLQLDARITKDSSYPISSSSLIENIRSELLNEFSTSFGLDVNIDRSRIIRTIRSVNGVLYVDLIKPKCDIRFKYEIPNELTQDELLDYTPCLICFTSDSISITIRDDEE